MVKQGGITASVFVTIEQRPFWREGYSMIEGLVSGQLAGTAEMRAGKNETQYAVAKVRVDTVGGENILVNVIAFSTEACKALL